MLGPVAGRPAGGDHGVHQPGAVEVHGEPVLAGPVADRGDALERVDPAAAPVVGVLEPDQPGPDVVDVVGPDGVLEIVEREQAEIALERPGRHAREPGDAPGFPDVDVGRARAEELVARAGCGRPRRSGWPSSPTARRPRPPCPGARPCAPRGALTVGSSPNTSSPTSASAIAFRMAGVGLVTVSDLRSIGGRFMSILFASIVVGSATADRWTSYRPGSGFRQHSSDRRAKAVPYCWW